MTAQPVTIFKLHFISVTERYITSGHTACVQYGTEELHVAGPPGYDAVQ